MDEAVGVRASLAQRIRSAWHAARLGLLFALALVGATAGLSLPLDGNGAAVGLRADEVATVDIVAPYAFAYTSALLTEQARREASLSVADVYDPPDSRVARQQIERLRATLDYIDSVRADTHATPEQQLADLQAIAALEVDADAAQALLALPESRWEAVKAESLAVLEQVMRAEIREDRLQESLRMAPALVSIALPDSQAALVVRLATAFVAPNSLRNAQATEAARQAAVEAVAPVTKSYAAGETIVARGQVVDALHLEALQAYGLLRPPNPWPAILSRGLMVTLLGCIFVLYIHANHPEQVRSTRMALTLAALFVASAFALQLMVPGHAVLPYLYPAATIPMLLSVLVGPGVGALAAMVTGVVAGSLGARGLELGAYIMLSGLMGALVLGRADRLSAFFWAGMAAAVAGVAVIVVFRFTDPATDMLGKATLVAAAILSGSLSASLGFGLMLLAGNLLGITTTLQLIELSRPDHPLLQYILRRAPGTYQHSLQVANLAEQAARAIGANALLTRVGALYHDAGKALRPHYFIENQLPGQNIHEQLDPTTSASVILAHVKDGLELARKHRLPAAIRAFIPEHHGKLEASYQLQSAVDAAAGQAAAIDPADFTYPGPRPRSRETAVLMLADGVEAKARAESPTEDEAIDRLVRWVISDRLTKGQLDRTELTLKDLDTIRRSFVNTLKGIYHPRIRYPSSGEGNTEPVARP